jgi:type I restriction enzyme, R subunit
VINIRFNTKQRAFLDFVLSHYVNEGVQELNRDRLTPLLRLRYRDSMADAVADLGKPEEIWNVFAGFQKYLSKRPRGRRREACGVLGIEVAATEIP